MNTQIDRCFFNFTLTDEKLQKERERRERKERKERCLEVRGGIRFNDSRESSKGYDMI